MEPATDRRLRWLAAGVSAGVLVASVAYGNAAGAPPEAIARVLLVAGSFLITGFFAWMRRPANRMGRLMIALGNCLLLIVFATPVWPAIVPLGLIGFTLAGTLLGYLILAYPSGELRSTADRILVILTAILVGGPRFIRMLADDPAARGAGYENPYLLIHDPSVADAMRTIPYLLDIVVLTAFVAFVTARWAHASGPTRRTLTPVLLPTLVLLLILLADAVIVVADVPVALKEFSDSAQLLARAVIPIGFLVGLLRTRMARAAVADLVVELGQTPTPARLRDALANALGDPSLQVAYWSPEAGSRSSMRPASRWSCRTTARARPSRCSSGTASDGGDHPRRGPPRGPGPGRLGRQRDAAGRRERSAAGRRSRRSSTEVRASRARIVEAGDAERQRVERDLHDGAQQRLVSLTLALRLAQTQLGDDADPAVRLSLEQASEEAKAALAELRELARGIHPRSSPRPASAPAIEIPRRPLAGRRHGRCRMPSGSRRPSRDAAYFVVSEALANVTKYAEADARQRPDGSAATATR